MGIFDFLKKKDTPVEAKQGKVLVAMPMLNNGETFDMDKVAGHLKTHWNASVSELSAKDGTAAFRLHGEMVVIGTVEAQIPWGDIEETAKYAYNWPEASAELKAHNVHLIVSVMSGSQSAYARYQVLTKVLASILATSHAIGVYQGASSLLIPRQQYLDSAETLMTGQVPIDLWVYIGLRKSDQGNHAYTYGLANFDKLEMEFMNSTMELGELHSFMSNICAYVIASNVTFRSGETLGYTADQKIRITAAQGAFVQGQVLKLEM